MPQAALDLLLKRGRLSNIMARSKTGKSLEESILKRFRARGRGAAMTPSDFLDLADRRVIAVALSRLVKAGRLRRPSRGVYVYPKQSELLGELAPNPEEIVKAISRAGGERVQVSGAYAANLLGLSDQVPAKLVYLTDGHSRKLQVRNLPIELRQASARRLATAGRVSGTVAEALRYLRKDQVDDQVVEQLRRRLSESDKTQLQKDIKRVPAWIGEVFRSLAADKPDDNPRAGGS